MRRAQTIGEELRTDHLPKQARMYLGRAPRSFCTPKKAKRPVVDRMKGNPEEAKKLRAEYTEKANAVVEELQEPPWSELSRSLDVLGYEDGNFRRPRRRGHEAELKARN